MNARKIRNLLSQYFDNELSYREKEMVEQNLAKNEKWQREYECLNSLQEALTTLPQLKAPSSLSDAIHCNIEKDTAYSETSIITLPRLKKIVAVAAIFTVVLLFTYRIILYTSQNNIGTSLILTNAPSYSNTTPPNIKPKVPNNTQIVSVAQPSISQTESIQQNKPLHVEIALFIQPKNTGPNIAALNDDLQITYTKVIMPDGHVEFHYSPYSGKRVKIYSRSDDIFNAYSQIQDIIYKNDGVAVEGKPKTASVFDVKIPIKSYVCFIDMLDKIGHTQSIASPEVNIKNTTSLDLNNDNFILVRIIIDLKE